MIAIDAMVQESGKAKEATRHAVQASSDSPAPRAEVQEHRAGEWMQKLQAGWQQYRPRSRAIFRAALYYYTWQLLTKVFLGVVYMTVISEGFRHLIPALALRLSKVPGLSALDGFEFSYRIDLAHGFAFFMLLSVCFLWSRILVLWLEPGHHFDEIGWDDEHHVQLILTLGVIILCADACFFYIGVTQTTWGGSSFSFIAVVATAAYLSVLIWVTYVAAALHKKLKDAERGL